MSELQSMRRTTAEAVSVGGRHRHAEWCRGGQPREVESLGEGDRLSRLLCTHVHMREGARDTSSTHVTERNMHRRVHGVTPV